MFLPYVATGGSPSDITDHFSNVWDDFTGVSQVEAMNEANIGIASARNEFEAEEAALARGFSADEAQKLRTWQDAQIKRQLDFQERMSSTAVQRRMQDLKKAGINPLLAGKYDASSPAGGAGAGGMGATAKANAHGATMQKGVSGSEQLNSALNIAQQFQQLRKTTAEADLTRNKEHTTRPVGGVGKDLSDLYEPTKETFKNVASGIGNFITNSAKSFAVEVGKIKDLAIDKGTKLYDKTNEYMDQGGLGWSIPVFPDKYK